MRRSIRRSCTGCGFILSTVLALSCVPQQGRAADVPVAPARRGYEFEGAYGGIGGAIRLERAGGGARVFGGYRFLPWLAAEGDLTCLSDGFYGVTAGAKLFPLGLLRRPAISDFVQPYGVVGVGTEVQNGIFAGRLMLGSDFWATDRVGFFAEAGANLYRDDFIPALALGAQLRF